MSDDDLTPFLDDPLVQALRAPVQEHELAGEDAALSMFRQSLPARRRRRAITRAGVTGAGIILGLGLSGGVAAAYTTDALPDPVQNAVHAALDPLPLPAPPTAHARHLRQVARAERRAERAAARVATHPPSPPARSGPRPSRTPAAVVPPVQSNTQPRPSASPTPAAPKPSMTVAVSAARVPVHGQVVLAGRLTRGTEPLPGHTIYAAELPAGESTWRRVSSGQTGSDGTISLTVPPLTRNVRLRLVTAQGLVSRQVAVVVVPKLTATSARSGNERVVTIHADGGRPGDELVLLRRDGTAWTRIASSSLASDSTGQFVVPGPGAAPVHYLVRLVATARHTASLVQFAVPAR
ncbi:MAG: hypothetical protein QOJ79_177 [Actinomycetota bacterium]|jgi:hypothetical protein|nr:hypothetical protein [Actinomycetota bacterium]